jgi:hypothetical protein
MIGKQTTRTAEERPIFMNQRYGLVRKQRKEEKDSEALADISHDIDLFCTRALLERQTIV